MAERFDAAYFRKYYEDPETRIYSAEQHAPLPSYVFHFADWNGIDIYEAIDIGAGIGLWKHWIEAHRPDTKYTGVDVSQAMCQRFGYQNRDIGTWKSKKKYDLVICQGVLQYIADESIEAAICNLAGMSRGLLFLEALTKKDVRENADLEVSDTSVNLRSATFYRKLLNQYFITIGGGLYFRRDVDHSFWELDIARP